MLGLRSKTDEEKRLAQNQRILKERPWLWALLQEWNCDSPRLIEIQNLSCEWCFEGHRSRNLLGSCGGMGLTAVAYFSSKNRQCVLLCLRGADNDKWICDINHYSNFTSLKEIAVLDEIEKSIVIFRVKTWEVFRAVVENIKADRKQTV